MSELPFSIKRAANRYETIEIEGIELRPVLVKEYDNFLIARPALEVLQQSFPVRFLRMPLLSALYQMDFESASNGEIPTGLFSRALLCLALSLRLGEGMDMATRLGMFQVVADREKPEELIGLRFVDGDGQTKEISPTLFQRIRPIIAAQNGVKIESDKADPDLVQAEKDLAEMNGVSLNATVEDLISGIAALSGTDEREIDEWPILKLDRRRLSFQRILDYMICGFGQVNGTTWKGGNPHPSPFFDRSEYGQFGAHLALGDFAGGAGERAVASAGQQVS